MTAKRPTYASIRDAVEQVEVAQRTYLKKRGWTATCRVPGSYWVWTRTYKDQALMADMKLACAMQANIDSSECECDGPTDAPNCPIHGQQEPA